MHRFARRPFWSLILAALMIAAPLAMAGTAEDPEVTDSDADSAHPDSTRDVVKGWIEEDVVMVNDLPHLSFNLVTKGALTQHLPAFFALHESYRFGFVPSNPEGLPEGAVEGYISFRPTVGSTSNTGTPGLGCAFGQAPKAGAYEDIANEESIPSEFTGNHFTCFLPTSAIGEFNTAAGHELTNLYIVHHLIQRGPTNGGDAGGVNEVERFDRAPDSGFGRVYGGQTADDGTGNGTGDPTGNGTQNITYDEATPDLAIENDTSVDSGNILGGEDYVIQFNASGTLAYHDHHHPASQGNVTVEAAPENGTPALHTVRIIEGAGNDTSTWSFEPAQLTVKTGDRVRWVNEGENAHMLMGGFSTSGEPAAHDHDDHEHDDNATSDDDGAEGNGIPGPGPVLVVVTLALALYARRRD